MSDYINKGKAYLENKQFSKALEFFQAALENMESPKEAYLGLAETYFALSKDEQGKVALFKAMALDPNNLRGLKMIQTYCFPNVIFSHKNANTNSSKPINDAVVEIVSHPKLYKNHWVAKLQSGNTLFFCVGVKGCTITSPFPKNEWTWKGPLNIPQSFTVEGKTMPVISIGKNAFCSIKQIENVCLPDGLLYIEDGAFKGCRLSEINFPKTLETIGIGAFQNNLFEEIEFPTSLYLIDDNCFSGCRSLSKVNLNEGLARIGNKAFANSKIRKVDLPKSVSLIGGKAFPANGILRFHGAPPEIDTYEIEDNYSVYVAEDVFELYEDNWDWNDIKIHTFK